jgi:hypothetical protein
MHNKTLNAVQFSAITVRHSENDQPTYTIKWSSAFPSGVGVDSSTWTAESSGLTISNESYCCDETSARFAAGDPGKYRAVNKIVDSEGDTAERRITIIFKDNNLAYDYGF